MRARNDRGEFRIGTLILLGILLIFVLSVVGFLAGWFNRGVKVISPENVSNQYDRVITDWEALKTSANNACGAQNAAANSNSPTLVEDPAFAYAATYRKIVIDYNARQADIFKAKLVGPHGYPKQVPQLDEGPKTDWCDVASQLQEIK